MPESVIIREMVSSDYDGVIDVWTRSGLPYRPRGRDSRESILAELKKDTAIFLVAEQDGRLVGTALCTHDGRKGWINRLAVVPEWRGRGVAKALVGEAEERFGRLGLNITSCLITRSNVTSQQFFEEIGYELQEDVLYYSKKRSEDS